MSKQEILEQLNQAEKILIKAQHELIQNNFNYAAQLVGQSINAVDNAKYNIKVSESGAV